jgi:hypothetical protein
MPLVIRTLLCRHCPVCWFSLTRLLYAIKADTKSLEVLSALWFFILAGYLHTGYDGLWESIIIPAMESIAPEMVWKAVLVFVGVYQLGAISYGRVWCRKAASLVAAALWVCVGVGMYYVAGNIPSVGLTAAMVLSMSIAALGLYDDYSGSTS